MRALFFILFLSIAGLAMGQGSGYYAKGQDYEYLKDFKRAEKFYKKGVKAGSIESQLALARLYYKTAQYKEALKQYTSLQSNESIFNNNDFIKFWHSAVSKGNTDLADSLMAIMVRRDILKRPGAVSNPEVAELKPFTNRVDGPQFFSSDYEGFILINTFIEDGVAVNDHAKQVGLMAMNDKGEVLKIKDLDLPFGAAAFNQGPVFYYPQGKYLFLTESAVTNGLKKLRFVYYTKSSGAWEGPFVPAFMNNTYNFAYPVVTNDGTLIFSSDKPGGRGGMDLYQVPISSLPKGKPTPITAANTKGDEVFPSIVDNSIFFSSNGFKGLGGLDIYRLHDNVVTGFGDGLNSPYDDLMPCRIGEYLYFTSNRKTKGVSDEVYRCKMKSWGSAEITEEIVAEDTVIEVEKKSEDGGGTKGETKSDPGAVNTFTIKLNPQYNNPSIDLNNLKVNGVRKSGKAGEADAPIRAEIVLSSQTDSLFYVVAGVFGNTDNAKRQADKLKAKGFQVYMVSNKGLTRIVLNPTRNKAAVQSTLNKVKSEGFDGFITGNLEPKEISVKVTIPENLLSTSSNYAIQLVHPNLDNEPLIVNLDKLKSGKTEMPLKEKK